MHVDTLELAHWGASAIALCTLLMLVLPRPGDCPNCIPWKWYAVLYAVVHNVANLKARGQRPDDVPPKSLDTAIRLVP